MEPDSNDRIPNFFLDNDKNTEDLNQEKSNETNSLESTPKIHAKSSKLNIHWSSFGIGAGIAIACVFCRILMTNMINDESAQNLDEIIINEISTTKKPTLSTFTDNASPVLGNTNAPLTMIEFGDYQCTYCKKFFRETEGLVVENYVKTGKVKIMFKDFIVVGGDSANAANAAHCANDQKMFWLYHSILYNNWDGEDTGWASFERLHEFANELELDMDEFSKCMSESKWEELVNSSQTDGRIIGVTATPTFFIIDQSNNILKITGAQRYDVFQEVVDSLLE